MGLLGVYVNLDPAAEPVDYEPDIDIKDLVALEDVMDEMGLGPNGGLMACFEYCTGLVKPLANCIAVFCWRILIGWTHD
jgi:hypothetical protein